MKPLIRFSLFVAVLMALPISQARAGEDRIAYSCSTYQAPFLSESDICVRDPDSSAAATNITNSPVGSESYPVYSPDASEIAFSGSYPSSYRDIFVTSAIPSGSAVNVSDSPACHEWAPGSSWSPNGALLTYQTTLCSPDPQDRVLIAPASGTSEPVRFGPLTQNQHAPDWSPDGTKIAYQGSGVGPAGIYVGPTDGSSAPAFLTNTGAGFTPEWSPDGSRILTVISPGSTFTLRVVNANGTGAPVDLATYGTIIYGDRYAWSPDGTKVAWIKHEGMVHINSASNPGDGYDLPAGPIVGQNISFSPDGSRVVFDAYPVPANDPQLKVLYTQKIDGSQAPVPITDPSENAQEPDWMPREGGPTGPTGPTSPTSPTDPSGPTGPTGPAKPPKTIIFANIKRYPTAQGGRMLIGFVDCNAQGSLGTNPFCQLQGQAEYGSARSSRSLGGASTSASRKKVIFAKGKLRIPAGKKKNFKLKITKAGKKLVKKGRNLKLKVTVKNIRKGYRPQVQTRTVTLKVKN